MSRASVVVVGGGISGLAAAWELSGGEGGPDDATPRVEVIEASDQVGGSLATTGFAGRTIDLGADGFLARRPEAVALVEELGLNDELEAIDASGAWLWSRGALHELPGGLVLGVPTDLPEILHFKGLSWRSRLAARRDALLPKRMLIGDDASIGEIVHTKLGRELSYQFIEPMVGGIQAGRIDVLSAKSVFPALLDAAKEGGSLMKALRPPSSEGAGTVGEAGTMDPVFYSLKEGIGSLPNELSTRLGERGVVLRRGVSVNALRRTPAGDYPWEVDTLTTTTPANAILLATPAPVVGALLGSLDPMIDDLRQIESAGAAMVIFALTNDEIALPPHGTGVLVPLGTNWTGEGSMLVTAVTFLDRKWPHLRRVHDVVLRAHVGRSDDTRWLEMTDEELTQRVRRELEVLLPHFGDPSDSLVQRWPLGLPQYVVGHEARVQRARAACAKFSVALAGNAYDGVGVPASIGSGRRAAREVLEMMGVESKRAVG
ncbi:MAG: protoporphyrinogen oxidase [Acidimicrobiales bacterium]